MLSKCCLKTLETTTFSFTCFYYLSMSMSYVLKVVITKKLKVKNIQNKYLNNRDFFKCTNSANKDKHSY